MGLFYCCHLQVKSLNYLSFFELLIILSLLLLKCGDIQPNPGPDSEFSSISSSLKGSHLDTEWENKPLFITTFKVLRIKKIYLRPNFLISM